MGNHNSAEELVGGGVEMTVFNSEWITLKFILFQEQN
jgi:hypothetical protein